MRLIDADDLRQVLEVFSEKDSLGHTPVQLCDAMPTIDAVEVVRGKWIIDGMNEYELSYGCVGYEPIYRCSKCGITTESYLRTERPIMPEDADFPNYCPNCGAVMKGAER